ncbi:MAG: restriction endonuclease subunit S [Gemella sp.]|nr:restriction endonuclease subunit S [Gemella sp.]
MNTKQLKDKILAMAMRGELVEQDPTDESAEILLEKIKEEKAKLITEKKIKKEKPLAEVEEDEIPYDLPQGWVWTRLGDVSKEIFAGGDKPEIVSEIKTEEYNVPIYANGVKDKGLYGYTTKARVTEPAVTISARGTIGYTQVREANFVPIVRLICIIPSSKINIDFLKYYFSYAIVDGEGTSIKQITVPTMKPKLIPLPPLAEQKRIVEKIETLFAEVDKLEESRENLDGLKGKLDKKLLDMAMRGELVEQDPTDESAEILLEKIKEEKAKLIAEKKIKKEKPLAPIEEDDVPYQLPQGWVWTRLGEILRVSSGKNLPAKKMLGGEYSVYGANGITGTHNEYIEENSKIVIGRVGSCGSVHITEEKSWITDNALMVNYSEDNIDKKYLYHLLIHLNLSKLSVATSQPVISGNKIYDVVAPLPPLAEQKRIVTKLEQVREIIKESL